jgi:hypothetical protein
MGQSVCRALTADSTATRNIQGARLPYICLHLVLLSVSGLAQAVVQVSHPIPLNDLRVL